MREKRPVSYTNSFTDSCALVIVLRSPRKHQVSRPPGIPFFAVHGRRKGQQWRTYKEKASFQEGLDVFFLVVDRCTCWPSCSTQ